MGRRGFSLGIWLAVSCMGCGADLFADNDDCRRGDFGTVMRELQRDAGQATSPFIGTEYVTVTLEYDECRGSYYVGEDGEYDLALRDEKVFEAWADDCLCERSGYEELIIDCTVDGISQTFSTQGVDGRLFLQIDYQVDDESLEGAHIPIGPLPEQSLTGCSPGAPNVRIQGFDGMRQQLWQQDDG